MSERIAAVLDQIEAEQHSPVIPKGITAPELAEMVMRGEVKLSAHQMRAMIELLPFHAPKLSAMSIDHRMNEDFASKLDRCIERSNKAKVIDAKVIEHRPDEGNG